MSGASPAFGFPRQLEVVPQAPWGCTTKKCLYNYPGVPHKAVAEVSKIEHYRRVELL